MSENLTKIHKYVGAGASIVSTLLLIPKKAIELKKEENDIKGAEIINKISLVTSIVSTGSSYIYYTDKYVKIDNEPAKWTIVTFVTLNLISVGIGLFLLARQEKLDGLIKKGFSGIGLPLINLGQALLYTKLMVSDRKNFKLSEIREILSKLMEMTNFLPINEALKKRPEVYFLVHGIRAELKSEIASLRLIGK